MSFNDVTFDSFNVTWSVDDGDDYYDVTGYVVRVTSDQEDAEYRPETFYIYKGQPDFESEI